jgi:hypothetical protein
MLETEKSLKTRYWVTKGQDKYVKRKPHVTNFLRVSCALQASADVIALTPSH